MQKLPSRASGSGQPAPSTLPIPAADALAASQALQNLIADEIAANAGWITFAHYMELALYAPQFGYYSGGAAKLGRDGDFTTAPQMSPLFGTTLARLVSELFAQTAPQIMEFGAGTGRLAWDILTGYAASGVTLEHYYIVELSSELRARQELLLRDFPQVQWLQQMPASFGGVVLGNEVLDAMPVQLVVKTEQGWTQLGVSVEQKQEQGNTAQLAQFTLVARPADAELAAQIATQIPDADDLPFGYITEVHAVAVGFMRSLAQMLLAGSGASRGALAILIDYGFPASEYYLGQRSAGTLMCHYRHHAHPDPFYLPGLQDITAHVDFTAMAQAAVDAGLELLAYTSQGAFLLQAGIAEALAQTPADQPLRYLPQANAVQKLISPAEMGELFKVLVVGAGVDLPARLLQHDRSHRL